MFLPQLLDKSLKVGEIHVWRVSLNKPISRFYGLLTEGEKETAERFHFGEDKNYYIVRRGVLRTILGYYLNVEPGQLQFSYGKNGKPALANKFGEGTIRFNTSHSRALALYAFTRDHEIGVDIEQIRDIPDMEQIVERYFSIRENAIFRTLPKSNKREAFFNCWTCKEAFIKATGDGLSYPLNRFDVSLVPNEPANLLAIEGDAETASQWSIQDLESVSGFAAALAVEGQNCEVYYCRWEDQSTWN